MLVQTQSSGVTPTRGNNLHWSTRCNKEDIEVLAECQLKYSTPIFLAEKKGGEPFGRVALPGRCARHLNLESHWLPMNLCNGCCLSTLVDPGGLTFRCPTLLNSRQAIGVPEGGHA